MVNDRCDELRREIDEIDRELLRLLNERARRALRVGREKDKANLPLHDPEREAGILESLKRSNGGPLGGSQIEAIFRSIIAACLDLERRRGREAGEAAGEA
jgi:chorismate mutase/prephenate dehydratase